MISNRLRKLIKKAGLRLLIDVTREQLIQLTQKEIQEEIDRQFLHDMWGIIRNSK